MDQNVARLAVLADNGDHLLAQRVRPIGKICLVMRIVKRRADVVAHSTVNGQEVADAVDILSRTDRVKRRCGFTDHGATGFDDDFRHLELIFCDQFLDAFHDCGYEFFGRKRLIEIVVANAKTAAKVQNVCFVSETLLPVGQNFDQLFCRHQETVDGKNLRADVAMNPHQVHPRILHQLLQRLFGLT